VPILVDTCVLIDVATDDPRWGDWSAQALGDALTHGDPLIVNPLILAEFSMGYERPEQVDEALPAHIYQREHLPFEAAFIAGRRFLDYRRSGGERRSPLPDFYIGAHAEVSGYSLLTRDARRFRTYFPAVPLITP
jgi:predicted nucleic acid-binding protein